MTHREYTEITNVRCKPYQCKRERETKRGGRVCGKEMTRDFINTRHRETTTEREREETTG